MNHWLELNGRVAIEPVRLRGQCPSAKEGRSRRDERVGRRIEPRRGRTPPIRAREAAGGCFPGAEKSPNRKMTQFLYGHSTW